MEQTEYRTQIMESIVEAYLEKTKIEKVQIYFHEEEDIQKYVKIENGEVNEELQKKQPRWLTFKELQEAMANDLQKAQKGRTETVNVAQM